MKTVVWGTGPLVTQRSPRRLQVADGSGAQARAAGLPRFASGRPRGWVRLEPPRHVAATGPSAPPAPPACGLPGLPPPGASGTFLALSPEPCTGATQRASCRRQTQAGADPLLRAPGPPRLPKGTARGPVGPRWPQGPRAVRPALLPCRRWLLAGKHGRLSLQSSLRLVLWA